MRLFVAVWPAPAVVSSLQSTVTELRSVGGAGALRWAAPEQWHVTLRFFGNAELDEARAALRTLSSCYRPAVVALQRTGRFGRRVLHVPAVGLEDLASSVVAATAGVGRPPDDRPFAGHLTLARARDRQGVDLRPWCDVPVAGEWPVAELTLVASHTARSGAAYEVVDRIPLRSPGEGP